MSSHTCRDIEIEEGTYGGSQRGREAERQGREGDREAGREGIIRKPTSDWQPKNRPFLVLFLARESAPQPGPCPSAFGMTNELFFRIYLLYLISEMSSRCESMTINDVLMCVIIYCLTG